MIHNELAVRFKCPHCNSQLKTPARIRGRSCRCPNCAREFEVPAQMTPAPEVVYPEVTPAPQQPAAVPFKFNLPNNLGGIDAKVTQRTADSLVTTVVGGFLVVIGVVLAVLFGIRRPSSA